MASIGAFVDIFFIQDISFAWSSMRDPLAIKYPSILTDLVVVFTIYCLSVAAPRLYGGGWIRTNTIRLLNYLQGSDNVCFHFCHGLILT